MRLRFGARGQSNFLLGLRGVLGCAGRDHGVRPGLEHDCALIGSSLANGPEGLAIASDIRSLSSRVVAAAKVTIFQVEPLVGPRELPLGGLKPRGTLNQSAWRLREAKPSPSRLNVSPLVFPDEW